MPNSDTQKVYRDFWQRLEGRIDQQSNTPLYFDADELETNYLPQTRNLPAGINYTFVSNTQQGYLQVKLHIWEERENRDEIFAHLQAHKGDIEADIGEPLEWTRNKTYDTVIVERDCNLKDNREQWDDYLSWLIEYGERFDEVFGRHLNQFHR